MALVALLPGAMASAAGHRAQPATSARPSLALATATQHRSRALSATSSVTFAPGTGYDSGSRPQRVVLGDVSGDGRPDIVTANGGGNNLSALLNVNRGSFTQPAMLSAAGVATNQVALGDFNGDGKLDAAVVSNTATVSVMLGNGGGTFSSATTVGTLSTMTADVVAVADVNGDGKLDIIVDGGITAFPNGTGVAVLLGNGNGTFQTPVEYNDRTQCLGCGFFATGVAVADLNGDGKPDIVEAVDNTSSGDDSGKVLVRLNQGGGVFSAAVNVGGVAGIHSGDGSTVAVADINNDGHPDIVAVEDPVETGFGKGGQRGISVLIGKGDGTFASPVYINDPAVGDTSTPPKVYGEVEGLAIADINGDGLPDVVTADSSSFSGPGGFSVYLNGNLTSPTFIATPGFTPVGLAVGDVNGDNKPDVVLENNRAVNQNTPANVLVMLNTTQPPVTGQPPPIGGAPSAAENPSGGNAAEPRLCPAQGSYGLPCNTASGSFSHTFTDFVIPGRGLALNFARTYSSVFAGVNGPLGFGWTGTYNMALTTDPSSGDVTVHQENGAQVTFTPGSGGGYTAPPRVTATLVKNGDGSFTFTRNAQQTFSFSAAGRLTKETDLNGYTTTLVYDGAGQLATVTDPAGRSLTFTYSGGHIVGIKDPAGRTVSFTYDANGNLASATDVNGGITKFTYDANHRLLTMTDPRGGIVTNTYDGQGRIVSQADPLNRTTTYAYTGDNMSASGGTTTVTDPKGNVTVEQYRYGLRISVTRGSGTPSAATWNYVYDPATLGITSQSDPNGHVTTKTYDGSGNLLTSTDALGRETRYTYNSFNEVLTATDPLEVATTNTYDARGNLIARSTPIGLSTATTTYTYGDSAHPGDVTSMTDPNGHTSTYTYDAGGDRTSTTDASGDKTKYIYNSIGERLTMVSPKGNIPGANPTEFTTTYTYDPFGDVLTVTDPVGNKTTNTYDPNRNLVKVVDTSGNVTRNSYDADNELTELVRTNSAGHLLQTLATTYDADGNVLSQINGLGFATETYSYDPLDRVVSATDALNRATAYTYDGAGNNLTLVDPSGRTTRFSYDAANELIRVIYSDGTTPDAAYTYDADGQRLTMTDGTGTTTYTYDALHRLTKDVQGDGQAVSYAYDPAGNLTQITYPNGKTITRSYDSVNRLRSVSTWLSAPNTVTFTYDPNSNLTNETYPNSVAATFTYDKADRLTSITDVKGGTSLLHLSYTRDHLGLVTAESDRAFGYDGLNRLTSDSLATTAYTYNAADELTKLTTSASTTTFGYDNANELKSSTGHAGTTTYAYDPQGNRMSATPPSSSPATYTYDQANRLTGFSHGTTTASYAYNGDGLRMSKTVNATAEPFAWNLAEGLPLVLRGGSTSYVTGPGGMPLEQISAGGAVAFYHQDQLGSTRMLTDSTGTVKATYTYNAYGSLSSSTGSVSQPFGFTGQYTDSESGLIYLRARYYDSATAQFLTRDLLVRKTRSPYGYVAGDPLNGHDPTGLDDCSLNPFSDNSCEIAAPARAATGVWNATGGQVVNNIQNFASSSRTLGVCFSVSGNFVIGGGTAEVCGVVSFQGLRPVGVGTTETFGAGAGPGIGVTGLVGIQASTAPNLKSLGGPFAYVGGSGGALVAGGGSLAGGVGSCGPFAVGFAGIGVGAGFTSQVGANYTFEQTWLGS
jgi:RHS repeat-associated protein